MHRREVYALKNNNEKIPLTKLVKDRFFSLGSAFCRLYDNGLFSHTVSGLRRGFLTLSTRVTGVFFFTFGIYSFLIALLVTLFAERASAASSLYGGAALAISSVPLLFSRGNVSTILTKSRIGNFICDQLNVRQEILDTKSITGHSSISFVLGVIAGCATMIFPLSYVISALALLLIFAVILNSPETGIAFMTVLLFITDIRIQYAILGVTCISYIFKLIRRKRTISFKKTDIVLFVFLLCTLFGTFITHEETADLSSLTYSLLLPAYFLCVCLIRERDKLLKLLYASVTAGGLIASLFILAMALATLLPAGIFAQPEFLYEAVSALPPFKSGFAPLAFAALIPVCAAFIVKPRSDGYRFTSCISLVSMLVYLLICGELAFALATGIATAIFLFVTGSRRVYLAMSAFLCGAVIVSFSGSLGTRLYNYAGERLSEAFNQAKDLSYISKNSFSTDYAFCGQGFNDIGKTVSNFYFSLISQLGVVGFTVLCVFLLLIFAEAAVLIAKTYRTQRCEEIICRYPSIGTPVEARACVLCLFCSILVCSICATFCNFFASPSQYLLLFLLCGFCVSYARITMGELSRAENALIRDNTEDRSYTKL